MQGFAERMSQQAVWPALTSTTLVPQCDPSFSRVLSADASSL